MVVLLAFVPVPIDVAIDAPIPTPSPLVDAPTQTPGPLADPAPPPPRIRSGRSERTDRAIADCIRAGLIARIEGRVAMIDRLPCATEHCQWQR